MPNRLTAFWRSLSDCNQPRIRYLGRALLVDLPVAYAVGLGLNWATGTGWPQPSVEDLRGLFFGLCVRAPILETAAMGVIIWVLRRFMTRTEYVPWVTALICAGLHSLAKPLWGIEIFWSFVIFSLCYVTWEKKSLAQAFGLTAILHALHNLVPLLVLLVSRRAS
ncbi:MAG: hypothetical protein PSV13_08750 [Lacunisphaera sp.]|nr:hypothetical protein [Lacunisphaera sp.]